MKFLKKYWHLVLVALLTVGLGIVTFLTTQQLKEAKPVAPTVPEGKPKAVVPACTLSFALATTTPTVTPTATPTPTGTVTPTPTGTPTSTPTPTPTSSTNTLPDCTGLSVNPSSGTTAPLTATLTCSGVDRDGDITAAEFQFGDSQSKLVEKNVGSPGSLSTTYVYSQTGQFNAWCRVRDNNFAFSSVPDSCKRVVTVGTGGQTTTTSGGGGTTVPSGQAPQAAPTPKVPVAGGGPSILGASAIAGGLLFLLLGLAL